MCCGAIPRRDLFSGTFDRLVFVGLYRLAPGIVDALAIVRPETVVRWHRAGFRSFWRWKSRRRGGRPSVPLEIRRLIRDMSLANPLWGAPRIHGELLKLGIDVGQTSVAKYMARRRGGPSQGWRTFLCNHADSRKESVGTTNRSIDAMTRPNQNRIGSPHSAFAGEGGVGGRRSLEAAVGLPTQFPSPADPLVLLVVLTGLAGVAHRVRHPHAIRRWWSGRQRHTARPQCHCPRPSRRCP